MKFRTFSIFTLLALLLVSVAPLAAQDSYITVTDRNGRTITLTEPPDLVVCLLNRCAEEMAAIGVPIEALAFGAPWTINVALNPLNYGEAAENAPTVPADDEVDWEAVAALQPDLIITTTGNVSTAEGLAPVYTLSWDDRDSNDAWFHDARDYGAIFGIEEQVEAQV